MHILNSFSPFHAGALAPAQKICLECGKPTWRILCVLGDLGGICLKPCEARATIGP